MAVKNDGLTILETATSWSDHMQHEKDTSIKTTPFSIIPHLSASSSEMFDATRPIVAILDLNQWRSEMLA